MRLIPVMVMAVALGGMACQSRAEEPVQPIVLSASLSPATPPVRSQTYEQWRASTPKTIATRDEAEAALVEAGMTPRAAASLSWLAANCEAPARDRDGQSIGLNLQAVGDNGLSRGPLQINVGWNPQYSDTYLFDLHESAKAAVEIWRTQGLSAWSCWR